MKEITCKGCDHCIHENKKMDILFRVMDNENDVTLADGKGIILRVSDSYEKHFGVSREEIEGKSVFELEKQGVFNPSVTVKVLEEKRKITLMQKNKSGDSILTTGVPIFDDNQKIQYVISFNAIDIAEMTGFKEQYKKLNQLMKQYENEVNKLNLKKLKDKELVTKSKSMETISELISQIADTDANVLITGETGVGKSMIAKILHQSSGRASGPFIEINCGTIPESLIESELFGYEKGSFTGASAKGKAGKIELAKGGTLFLDEIGELPLNMQIKLLQVIQEKVISRIGGLSKIDIDFRLIAATNKDLQKNIKKGTFREDLFYRLNVIPVTIPPLRERVDDIVPLIDHFLEYFNKKYDKNVTFSEKVFEVLERQKWLGNTRQIENLVERLVIISKEEVVELNHLPGDIEINSFKPSTKKNSSLAEMMEEYEQHIFKTAYEKHRTSVAIAKALGISQATAARRLRKYLGKEC